MVEYWSRFVRDKEIVLCVKEFNQIKRTPPTAPAPAVSDSTAVHVSAGISSFVGSAATSSKVDLSKIKTFNQLQPASIEYTLKVNCVEKIQLENRDFYVLVDQNRVSCRMAIFPGENKTKSIEKEGFTLYLKRMRKVKAEKYLGIKKLSISLQSTVWTNPPECEAKNKLEVFFK